MIQAKWYSEKELDQLGLAKRSTLRTWRWLGRGIPFFKFGRAVRYWGPDVEEFANKHRVKIGER